MLSQSRIEKKNRSKIIVGDFNTPLSTSDRINGYNKRKDIKGLNIKIHHQNLHKSLYPKKAENFFQTFIALSLRQNTWLIKQISKKYQNHRVCSLIIIE